MDYDDRKRDKGVSLCRLQLVSREEGQSLTGRYQPKD